MNTIDLKLKKYFKGKKVFITGHTGFKGSWLSYLLHKVGAEVMVYALKPKSDNDHFCLLNLQEKINHVEGDITDSEHLNKKIINFQPDYVFHLAAQALVHYSYANPFETYSVNVMGSLNLLDAVKNTSSIRSLIYVTSDKCYENIEINRGYHEEDTLGGQDPYSSSKAAAEILFSSYYRSFLSDKNSLGAASVRAGNVIGGGDWSANRIIPDCIKAIEKDIPILLRHPNATRPWQHVLEPLSGYLLLASKLYDNPSKFYGSWNFGPSHNDSITVKQIASLIIENLGKGTIEIQEPEKNIHEAKLLQLNCTKAKKLLNWHSRWDSKKTLQSTADWYKSIMNGEKAEDITFKQICEFFPEIK